MSNRAIFVARESGVTRFFAKHVYDPRSCLLMGQDGLGTFMRVGPGDELARLDDVWGDAGVLMDADARRLLYFGGECAWEIGAREVLNAFLAAEVWPGWDVRFCPRCLADFARALDLEPEASRPAADGSHLLAWDALRPSVDSAVPGEVGSLVLIRRDGASFVHTLDTMFATDLLDYGERLVDELSTPGFDRWTSGIDGDGICSALVVDCDRRRLTCWYVDADDLPGSFARFWPNWEIVDLADDRRALTRATGGAVAFDESVDLDRALASIRAFALDGEEGPQMPEGRFESLLASFLVDWRSPSPPEGRRTSPQSPTRREA